MPMTDAGTPWGEPRRDALAEVIWNAAPNLSAGTRGNIERAVLQHLASQRQEQDDDGCGPHHEYRGEPVDCGEYIELVVKPLRAQAAAQGDLVARLVDLVKMMARCLREAGRGDLADVALAELPPSRTP